MIILNTYFYQCKSSSPTLGCIIDTVLLFLIFFLFCIFRAAPEAHGGSQARGQMRAVADSHSIMGSELHLLPTPQLTATPDL